MLNDRLWPLAACHFAGSFRDHTNLEAVWHHPEHLERPENIQEFEFVEKNNSDRSHGFH